MERLCFFIHLKPGVEAEYERLHREMWPEMTAALQDCGFTNYTLFRRDLLVVGYLECVPSVVETLGAFDQTEVSERWNKAFAEIIDYMSDAEGRLLAANEVWHLD